ncbi:MAG: hypothetical protein WAM89_12245 [Terriglobales bacterium]
MVTQRWILTFFTAVIAVAFIGCSSGSTANVQDPPPPPASNISIAFQPEPGASLAVGFSETITAAVSNDSNNYGVDWSLVCPGSVGVGNCGTLTVNGVTSTHTASGSPITYTAPPQIVTGSLVVEIVALATANQAKNVVAPVTVTTFDSELPAGNYVLAVQGVENTLPYQFAAVVTLDGNGNVTKGEQTVNSNLTSVVDNINPVGSSYFIGNDGRGQITLATGDTTIGGNGIETFAFVFLGASPSPNALLSQVDLGSAATGASATGTLVAQTSTDAPTGGYAFAVNGVDVAKTNPSGVNPPVAVGGVLNVDSANTISGKGSVTDEILGKKIIATALGLSGTLTPADQFGGFTLNLTAPFGVANKPIPLQFTGYIVDSAHIQLIETDSASGSASPFGVTSGVAIGQGAATGTFTDNAAFSGTYVFNVPGIDLSSITGGTVTPNTLTSLGLFTADGNGNFDSGYTDTFLQLNCAQLTCAPGGIPGAQIRAAFQGTYSVDSSGTGRATLTSITLNPEPKHSYNPALFFYLTGNGNPALVLEGGDTAYPSIGTGLAYLQSAPAFGGGDYGLSYTQVSSSGENDGTGQLNASLTAQTVAGFADSSANAGSPSLPDQAFGGTFGSPTVNVPFAGTLENVNQSTAFSVGNNTTNNEFGVNFYIIDADHGFFVETDLVNPSPGSDQVSFGYFAARTPLCTGCP